jgi:hypothetical protein
MTTQLTELRAAETASTSAQARLAHLETVRRKIAVAMVSAGLARARELLSPEDMKLFGDEVFCEVAAEAVVKPVALGMDDLTDIAEGEAQTASDFLHELESEQFDVSHPVERGRDGMTTAPYAIAAE